MSPPAGDLYSHGDYSGGQILCGFANMLPVLTGVCACVRACVRERGGWGHVARNWSRECGYSLMGSHT